MEGPWNFKAPVSEVPDKWGRCLYLPGITRQPLLSWGPMQYPSGRSASHIGLAQLCTRGGQAIQPLLREASPCRGSLPGWQADATSGQRVSEASKRKPGSRHLASVAALCPASQDFLLQDLWAGLFSERAFFLLASFLLVYTNLIPHEADFCIHFLFLCILSNFNSATYSVKILGSDQPLFRTQGDRYPKEASASILGKDIYT